MSAANIDWKLYAGGWNDTLDCMPLNNTIVTKDTKGFNPIFAVLPEFPALQDSGPGCRNIVNLQDLFANVSAGYLPQVSWVIPGGNYSSEHPGTPGGIYHGQLYVSSVINAIESNASLYNSTAIFLTWDDWGGYYDSIPPNSQVDGLGYGFRVPLIIISPYVSPGTDYGCNGKQPIFGPPLASPNIGQTDFTAFLKTIESVYGLQNLTDRDGSAYSLFCLFNFNQKPIPPLFMPMGQLGIWPVQNCLIANLCFQGFARYPASYVQSLFQAIPYDNGQNDLD